MAKKTKRSPLPVYAVALVWLVWGICLPLYRMPHFLLAAASSAAAFLVAKALWRDRVIMVPDPKPAPPVPPAEINPQVTVLKAERERALSEMRRLNDSIQDPKVSAQIDHLEEITGKIMAYVVENPQKLPQIRRFLDYYLPTTLKLLNAYDRMGSAGISGTNIDSTIDKIGSMLDTVSLAFDKQLDALFADEALDISTDITVMEQLLTGEGLGGTQMGAQ